jgi:TolB protein
MKRALLLVALSACGDDKPTRSELPGTIYFVEDAPGPQLVRLAAGARTVIGGELFPSGFALPDGRLVAIASRGDGSPDGEQLALIGRDGRVERIGPAAAQVRDPAVDMRGRWIVVAMMLDGRSDLYKVELTGTTSRLTNNIEGNFAPALAGESVFYVSSRDGNSEIYREAQRLTASTRDDWQPTPSPDGKTIAFLSDRDGTPHLYMMNADGANLRRVTTHAGEESAPTWSHDGKQLAYVAGGHVWVREAATGNERDVTPAGARDLEPSFSPDGKWLAVARMRGNASDLVAISLDGGDSTPIATNARLPRWR